MARRRAKERRVITLRGRYHDREGRSEESERDTAAAVFVAAPVSTRPRDVSGGRAPLTRLFFLSRISLAFHVDTAEQFRQKKIVSLAIASDARAVGCKSCMG